MAATAATIASAVRAAVVVSTIDVGTTTRATFAGARATVVV
jgi:hypothetical protein